MTYRSETAAPTASALEHAPLSQKSFLLSFARIAPDRGLGAPLRASLLYPVARAWSSAFSAWWAAAAAEPALTWVYLPSAPGSASGGRQIRTGHPRRGLRRGRRATVVAAMAWAWRYSSGDAHYSAARPRVLADLTFGHQKGFDGGRERRRGPAALGLAGRHRQTRYFTPDLCIKKTLQLQWPRREAKFLSAQHADHWEGRSAGSPTQLHETFCSSGVFSLKEAI